MPALRKFNPELFPAAIILLSSTKSLDVVLDRQVQKLECFNIASYVKTFCILKISSGAFYLDFVSASQLHHIVDQLTFVEKST